MKLCAAALVGNECDIIEVFARHTLTLADHLHITFHNSYDSSQEIVRRLIGEGLSITTELASDPAFRRERLGCEVIRKATAVRHFDYVLPLDADELIAAESRAVLEAELAAAPADGALSVAWLSYVPTPEDDPAEPNPVRRLRHRQRKPHPSIRKVFFRADLMQRFNDVVLADGNHLLLSTTGRAISEHRTEAVRLAHYPVRSADQFVSKAVLGAVVRQASPEFTHHQSRHWRGLMLDPAFLQGPTPDRLQAIARAYLGEAADGALVDAPLATPIRELRYAGLIRVDPFARLAGCISALAAAGALRPADAASGGGDDTIAVSRAEHRSLVAELDNTRRLTQKLQSDAAVAKKVRSRWRRQRRWLAAAASSLAVVLLAVLLMP